jgi:hypothetical protein
MRHDPRQPRPLLGIGFRNYSACFQIHFCIGFQSLALTGPASHGTETEQLSTGKTGLARIQLETELTIIAEVGYEDLFLITWDLHQTCRELDIEWITRGSAADSLVCYCLGISDVAPSASGCIFVAFSIKNGWRCTSSRILMWISRTTAKMTS